MKSVHIARLIILMLSVPLTARALEFGGFIYSTNGSPITVTINGYTGAGGVVNIPSTINGKSVVSIGASAFERSALTSINIPGSVTNIGNKAFYTSISLETVIIPDSIVTIGDYAFCNCVSLTDVVIPKNVSNIGHYSFMNCIRLNNVVISNSVTRMGMFAFADCYNLKNLTIPDSVINIGGYAFFECTNLTFVTIGNGVNEVGFHAFEGCRNLIQIKIGTNVSCIGEYAFANCKSLANITINSSSYSIERYAFSACTNLEDMILDGVVSIGANAFEWCSKMRHIVVGENAANIGNYAFSGCDHLKGLYFKGNAPTIGAFVFPESHSLNEPIAYYLASATGWGSTFGDFYMGGLLIPGQPTMLWALTSPPGQSDVLAWGLNMYFMSTVPVEAQSGVGAIAAGGYHTVALKNGKVLAWGDNSVGQCTVSVDAQSGVGAIAAGDDHTVALKNGKVLAWGDNYWGQCTVPVDAQSGVGAIAAGNMHTVALKNGKVLAWGYSGYGQLDIPVEAQSGVSAIAKGGTHTVALKSGRVIAWGNNGNLQCSVPLEAQSGVSAIAAGACHTVALKSGKVLAWGENSGGLWTVPVEAQSGVTAIVAGGLYTDIVALKNGKVLAWGGDNGALQRTVPEEAQSGVTAIAAGGTHTVALRENIQYSLNVLMPFYAIGSPTAGMQYFRKGTYVNGSITNSPVVVGGVIQYVCCGWLGTGSVPSSGVGTNTYPFILTTNSSITWQWTTNYWMDAASNGSGSVNISDGWWPRGSNVQISATPVVHYHFAGWSGQTNGCTMTSNLITAPMTQARTITANFAIDQFPLVVTTPFGKSSPAGITTNNWGSSITATLTNSPVLNGATQYVCKGWTGAGSAPSIGAGTNTGPFTLTNNSSIAWLWTTNYWLATATNGNGSIDVTNQWCGAGTNLIIIATSSDLNRFTGWSGLTNGCIISGNQITVLMDRARTITAKFVRQYNLSVETPYGQGVPDGEANWYDTGSSITARLTNSPVHFGTTQFVCKGWAGTGSVPVTGNTTNAGPFSITNNSSISWLWRANFWLDVSYNGKGSLSTNDCWLSKGTNLLVAATPSNHWHFAHWGGDTNGCSMASNKITVAMDSPRAISASFIIDTNRLIVSTPYGQANLPLGTNWFNYGTSNSVGITNFPDALSGTQYVCKGWAGTGSIPASGVTSNTPMFTLTNDSSIVWKWGTNYWLETSVAGPGSVNVSNRWVQAGTNILITATPSNHYHFVSWSGDTNSCTITTNKITVPMSIPRSINGTFGIDVHKLVVATLFGQSVPPVGTNWCEYGAVTNAVMLNDSVTGSGTQFVCKGWTGTGSVPVTGTSTNISAFTVTNDSSVTWQWTTNYWLDTVANGSGVVSVDDGWFGKGSNVLIIATGTNHNHFVNWSGNTNGCTIVTNRITAPMTQARSIVANYALDPVLIVNSDYGVGNPRIGTNWCDFGSSVSARMTNSPVVNASTQYVCRGWVGTGSVPAGGTTTNAGPFTITTNSTITWLWKTNYWLDVAYTGKGSLSTNDCWLALGTNLLVTATPSNHWHFTKWGGDTNGCTIASNKITVSMNNPRAVNATFTIDTNRLIVATPFGQANLQVGTNWFDYGSSNSISITNAPVIFGGTQYVCKGWTGAGSVPVSGTTTNTPIFTLTNDSSIVWKWGTNYWLHVDKTGTGALSTNDAWVALATNIQVTATAATYFAFSGWQGQTNGCTIASNKITVLMNSARTIMVVFNAALATNNVPKWWLAQYGLTNFNSDAMSDMDHDGMLTWQEWVAGCNPADSNSVFRFSGSMSDSSGQGMVVRWPSISNRFYDLSRATNLMGTTPFTILMDASNMPAMPPENVYTDSVQGVGPYFYKIGVHE